MGGRPCAVPLAAASVEKRAHELQFHGAAVSERALAERTLPLRVEGGHIWVVVRVPYLGRLLRSRKELMGAVSWSCRDVMLLQLLDSWN